MAPSDMELTIGDIPDYNNKIVIDTAAQDLGLNDSVNAMPVPPKHTQPVQGTKTRQSLPEASPISPQEDHKLGQKELTSMPGEYKHSDKHEKINCLNSWKH